ncbi:hypothetical protein Pelo_17961 [Pelomyxa schiedti]|nr:hypothetical protein Pelo_17961 [Pelomyxa schiedti]
MHQTFDPSDVVHFVTYDDKTHVVFQNGDLNNKEALKSQVKKYSTAAISRTKRILLFSDGHANEGVTSVEGLKSIASRFHESGVSVSTFGIGNKTI